MNGILRAMTKRRDEKLFRLFFIFISPEEEIMFKNYEFQKHLKKVFLQLDVWKLCLHENVIDYGLLKVLR